MISSKKMEEKKKVKKVYFFEKVNLYIVTNNQTNETKRKKKMNTAYKPNRRFSFPTIRLISLRWIEGIRPPLTYPKPPPTRRNAVGLTGWRLFVRLIVNV